MKKIENYNLEIKRENGTSDEIAFSFRFNFLEEQIAFDIRNMLDGFNIEFNKPKNKDFYVILFEVVDSTFDVDLICRIIKKFGLTEKNYGFWISITSEYGHGGGYIPKEILNMYKKIGGQIDFSYMIGS